MQEPARQRRRMDCDARRAQLLEIAQSLFAVKGFDGTTTREIARAAGITEALIFRHFASKEALYEAVIEAGVVRSRRPLWRDSLTACMAARDDEGFFRHLVSFVIEMYRADAVFQRTLVQALLGGHRTALRYLHRVVDPLRQSVADYVTERQREGAMRPGDPLGVVTAVLGMAREYAVVKYVYRHQIPKMSDAEAVELFVSIAMGGLTVPAPPRRRAARPRA